MSVFSLVTLSGVTTTPYIIDSLSSINSRQRRVRVVDQTHLFGMPLQFLGVHFGRPCFGLRSSVGGGLLPGAWGSPIPTGPKVFLANAGRVWAATLCRTHLVPNSLVRWGARQSHFGFMYLYCERQVSLLLELLLLKPLLFLLKVIVESCCYCLIVIFECSSPKQLLFVCWVGGSTPRHVIAIIFGKKSKNDSL